MTAVTSGTRDARSSSAVAIDARAARQPPVISLPAWRKLPLAHLASLRVGLALVDWAVATSVFLVASFARFGDGEWLTFWQRLGIDVGVAAASFGVVWVGCLWTQGLYVHRTSWPTNVEFKRILRATVLVIALTLSALFLVHEDNVSRMFLIVLFTTMPVVAMVGRSSVRTLFGYLRMRGNNGRHVLIVGTNDLAEQFADLLEAKKHLGLRVVGHLAVGTSPNHATTRPLLGNAGDLANVLHSRTIDEIVVCGRLDESESTKSLMELAATEGKTVRNVFLQRRAKSVGEVEEEFDNFVVRSATAESGRELGLLCKRMTDVVGATLGLIILSPVLLGVAALVRVSDGGPALFRQVRVGLNGRLFTIYKFRTMVVDADDRFAEVKHLSETHGAAFKMTNDPRTTKIGRHLRALSIDELPQLVNVLRGEMSLVGPRPAPPREVDEYDIWHRRRLSMKPGITGLWQIDSRLDEDFDERAALDLVYIERWSTLLDWKLMIKTIPALFTHRGL